MVNLARVKREKWGMDGWMETEGRDGGREGRRMSGWKSRWIDEWISRWMVGE